MTKRMKKIKKKEPSILLSLYDNALLRTKVDSALDMKQGYAEIVKICEKYNLNISIATISRYASARKESIRTGVKLRRLLDGSTKAAVDRLKSKEKVAKEERILDNMMGRPAQTPSEALDDTDSGTDDTDSDTDDTDSETDEAEYELAKEALEEESQAQAKDNGLTGTVTKYVSDGQVLDTIIAQGMQSIVMGDAPIAPKDLLKAIEVKAKLTNNANQGLSLEGLQELRVHVMARDNAVAQALMKYVPEDKQAEALTSIDEAEQEMLKNMDVTAQGKEILKALHAGGIKL